MRPGDNMEWIADGRPKADTLVGQATPYMERVKPLLDSSALTYVLAATVRGFGDNRGWTAEVEQSIFEQFLAHHDMTLNLMGWLLRVGYAKAIRDMELEDGLYL